MKGIGDESVLWHVPVIKLPPVKLEPSLMELAASTTGLRSEVVKNILKNVYKGFDEKRAFRALVAPTLTRLHFARSKPPYFRMAPNAKIWNDLDPAVRPTYVSLVLYDAALVFLHLNSKWLPPRGNLRDAAKKLGATMVDRVRGLDAMLKFYAKFHPSYSDRADTLGFCILTVNQAKRSEWNTSMIEALPKGRIIGMDEARYVLMHKALHGKILASSYVIDELIRAAMGTGQLNAFKGPYAAIDSLIMDRFAFNAIMLRDGR
jgi:hypothetical protein